MNRINQSRVFKIRLMNLNIQIKDYQIKINLLINLFKHYLIKMLDKRKN